MALYVERDVSVEFLDGQPVFWGSKNTLSFPVRVTCPSNREQELTAAAAAEPAEIPLFAQ